MSLLSYVQSFQINVPTDRVIAGVPIDLSAGATEILDIPNTEVITGEINLNLVFKHVQLPAETSIIPWPAPGTVGTSVVSGLSAAPNPGTIEGWLANITGTVPVGIRDISQQIQIDLRWEFFNMETSEPLTNMKVIDGSLNLPQLTIVIPPFVTELTTTDFEDALANVQAVKQIGVQLVVRGRVGTTQDTNDVRIPATPIPIPIYPIPLPSVSALFRDEELTGDAVLLMVPKGSPFSGASAIVSVLSPLQELLGTVNTVATTTTWATGTRGLYTAVTSLANRIPLTRHVGFKATDKFDDLGHYNFIVIDWWPDTDIEDRGSSVLLVSASRAISFYQHDDQEGKRLTLDATPTFENLDADMSIDEHFGGAVIRRLHVHVPESLPAGCVDTSGTPSGGVWGDVISSYEWGAVEE